MNNLQGSYGHMPQFMGSFENLRYLNVADIPFTGRVPSQLGNLSNLQYLGIGPSFGSIGFQMYSTDITWLTKLQSLQYLSLNGVNLSRIDNWPRTLNMIPSLGVISLQYCSLNSTSQSFEHFNLTKLGKLDLSGNYLGDPVASGWFWNATDLKYLALNRNQLVGPIPPSLGNLKCLITLDLSENQLNGSLPTEIGALPNLKALDLSHNNFSGEITEEHLRDLKTLTYIKLSFNNVKVVVDSDWLPPFTLNYAGFAYCQMGPLFPAWLQRLEGTGLDISNTGLKGEIPGWFWSTFSGSSYLNVANNQLSGSLPSNLSAMPFDELHLASNMLTGPIPSLPKEINVLDISKNNFSGTLPSNIGAPEINILLMYSNKINGYIPESLCELPNLFYLDLSNNILEGEIPQCLGMQNIHFLLLSNNSLSGKLPAILQNNIYLEFLDLAWNQLSGRVPPWIEELRSLRFLLLGHNKFSGNIPVQITNLSYLQYLDLSSNNFSGAIPWNLSKLSSMTTLPKKLMVMDENMIADNIIIGSGNQLGEIFLVFTKGQQLIYGKTLKYFVSIDLSGNFLTGEIPTDVTSLSSLMNLNLSSNQLSGEIPRTIGAMQSLISFDLSKNKICGEIPPSLSDLSSLSYLNLSCNNLSGRIPSGRQLDTLNADNPSLMYIGNSGLCGPPLQKNCLGNTAVIHGYLSGSKQEFEPLTFYFGLMLGLVAGHWVVFAALLFNKTWRISYFRTFDKMHDKIYVFVVVKWASFSRNTTVDGATSFKDQTTELQQIE